MTRKFSRQLPVEDTSYLSNDLTNRTRDKPGSLVASSVSAKPALITQKPNIDTPVPVNSSSEISTPPTHTSDSMQMPIEDFLQRLTRRNPRRYGRRNRRIIRSSSPSPPPHRNSGDEHCEERPALLKRLHRRHIDDDDSGSSSPVTLMTNETITRPPLHLVPAKIQGPTRKKHRAIRPWATVDPKRGIPFRAASFKSNDLSSVHQQPLTRWKINTESSVKPRETVMHKRNRVNPPKRTISRCQPLFLVPVADAEEAYSTKLHANKFCIPV